MDSGKANQEKVVITAELRKKLDNAYQAKLELTEALSDYFRITLVEYHETIGSDANATNLCLSLRSTIAIPTTPKEMNEQLKTRPIKRWRDIGEQTKTEVNPSSKSPMTYDGDNTITKHANHYERVITNGKRTTRLVLDRSVKGDIKDLDHWREYKRIFKENKVGGKYGNCIKFLTATHTYHAEIKDDSRFRIFGTETSGDGATIYTFNVYRRGH